MAKKIKDDVEEYIQDAEEQAYRRGVHQTLATLEYFLEKTKYPIDKVLPLVIKKASGIRGSNKRYQLLLDYLFEDVKKELANKKS